MCDAGMDGDMYNPHTSSGKWYGTKPTIETKEDGEKVKVWPVQPLTFKETKAEAKKSLLQRIINAFKI